VVIVGAGHAGGALAALLKQYGHPGEIVLIGEEPVVPYQRPPLSKAYLKGEADVESLKLRPDSYYAQDGVRLLLDETVTAIDRTARSVTLRSGAAIGYDWLVLATGAQPRRLALPGAGLNGVLELRSVADADTLRRVLTRAGRLAIIGGGYIGLEAAASARAAGVEVVMLEREARVLARVASPAISGFFDGFHRAQGVEIVVNADLAGIEGTESGGVEAVVLADGRRWPCDAVLVGVGAVARDELARQAGLACETGILVDSEARTSDPAIFAIGDVTWRPVPLYDRRVRLESVGNALEQARQTACAILGRPAPTAEVPWFWSDQYALKLQLAGLALDAETTVLRGSIEAAKFAVFHLRDGRIRALEAVNAPGEFVVGKKLIGEGRPVSPDALGDVGVPMSKVAL
jgi:3-phenylpropionate/trans-cinnamate dioxygenase ferredoxin reductase subunit